MLLLSNQYFLLCNLRRPSNLQFPSHDPLMAFAVEVFSLRNQTLMDRAGQQGLALLPDRIAKVITSHAHRS